MRKKTCRGCGFRSLVLVHDFGLQPLAGVFPTQREKEKAAEKYFLDLSQCTTCGLLQVTNVPPIDKIFHNDYRYSSSTVPSLVRHFKEYTKWLSERLQPNSRILEFGCNDGVLLSELASVGFHCKGVDASENIAKLARSRHLDVDVGFFGKDYVQKNNYFDTFDLITCSNVYAHIDDLEDVTQAVWLALKINGLFCIEVHDGGAVVEENQFDTIYHEHLTYFTRNTIKFHLEINGFNVLEIHNTDMHGGGLRLLARKIKKDELKDPCPFNFPIQLQHRPHSIEMAIDESREMVYALKRKHGQLWGYGAAGRSQMFLNFTKTGDVINSVFDDSILRQNRYIVGTDTPILPFTKTGYPGACIILSWNYANDIAAKIAPYFDAVYTVLPKLKKWN